ncbi:Hypothetical protein PENO1_017810 [Penicillium occitanis (nom. inval.)]|nr:Hypothetical protein PENO1_017810 [Penicillium occitanis (nom. inval.)]PCH07250.1 hypothetical protein PENOC_019910 [Penicillium occitanis (nom. inval.)]
MANTESSGMPFVISTSMNKADPEIRKLIRSHCMLGKNRGRILHSRRKPVVQKLLDLEAAASAVPNKLGSELSLLRFADSVEPSTLWELLKFTSTSKQMFFPLERCFDFNVKDRSMFEPLTFDPAYLNAVMFGAQTYLDLVSGQHSSKLSSVQMLKTIQLLRNRLLSISNGNEQTSSISNPTILVVLTLAHVAHLTGDHIAAELHLAGLCKIINLRGGIAAFQNAPKLLTELLRCDISIAIQKGTKPVFDFNQPLQPLIYLPQTRSYGKDQYTNLITDKKLAESWDTLSNFCHLVNSAADKNIKLSDQILLNTMGSVMYALLGMNFSTTNPINEAIRLGILAFCSHIFLERRGIRLPNGYLRENYRSACFEDVPRDNASSSRWFSLWFLMIGKISIFTSDNHADDDYSAWIKYSYD